MRSEKQRAGDKLEAVKGKEKEQTLSLCHTEARFFKLHH